MTLSLKNTFLSYEVREEAYCSPPASRRTRSFDATELHSDDTPAVNAHLAALNQLLENKEPSGCITSGFRKVSSCSSISTMTSEEPAASISSLTSWADCVDSDEDVRFDLVVGATPKASVDCTKVLGRTPVRRSGGPAGSFCRTPARGGLGFPAAVGRSVKPSGAPVCRPGPVMTTVIEEQAPLVAKCDIALVVPSQGSVGHETGTCAAPCKYFWKARGCKEGAQCSHCHLCTWSCKLHSRERRARAKEQQCLDQHQESVQ